jgi:hypothetical protein
MSVTDEIILGGLTMKPMHFSGTTVQLEISYMNREPLNPPDPTEPEATVDVPTVVLDANGGKSSPVLPIAMWEALQHCATQLVAYETLLSSGAAGGKP